jgi:zinc transport system substrate-binding protein
MLSHLSWSRLAFLVVAIHFCSALTGQAEKLKVTASFLPLYAHAKSVAGDLAEVSQLLGAGVGPHDFQFKPSDVKKIANTDLLILNGLGLEEWMEGMVAQAKNKNLVIIDTSRGVPLTPGPQELTIGLAHSHEGHDHGEAGGANPHIWLDPVAAQQQVKSILQGLQKADPKNASGYQTNADRYLAELQKLDAEFAEQLSLLQPKNLITFHEAFPYLAKRYGLNYLGFIEQFPEKAPSPKELSALVDIIKRQKVKVLFAEGGYEPKLLKTIAQQTGAIVAQLDTLEVGAPLATAYLDRMRSNLAALKKAWQ